MAEKCVYCESSELETVRSRVRPREDGKGVERVLTRQCKDYTCKRPQPEPVIVPLTSSLPLEIVEEA